MSDGSSSGLSRCMVRERVIGSYDAGSLEISVLLDARVRPETTMTHEIVHRNLTEQTTGGWVERVLRRLTDIFAHLDMPSAEAECFDAAAHLVDRSWVLHEGAATYCSLWTVNSEPASALVERLPAGYVDALEGICTAFPDPRDESSRASHSFIAHRAVEYLARAVMTGVFVGLIDVPIVYLRDLTTACRDIDPDLIFRSTLEKLAVSGEGLNLLERAPELCDFSDLDELNSWVRAQFTGTPRSSEARPMYVTDALIKTRLTAFDSAIFALVPGATLKTAYGREFELKEVVRRWLETAVDELAIGLGHVQWKSGVDETANVRPTSDLNFARVWPPTPDPAENVEPLFDVLSEALPQPAGALVLAVFRTSPSVVDSSSPKAVLESSIFDVPVVCSIWVVQQPIAVRVSTLAEIPPFGVMASSERTVRLSPLDLATLPRFLSTFGASALWILGGSISGVVAAETTALRAMPGMKLCSLDPTSSRDFLHSVLRLSISDGAEGVSIYNAQPVASDFQPLLVAPSRTELSADGSRSLVDGGWQSRVRFSALASVSAVAEQLDAWNMRGLEHHLHTSGLIDPPGTVAANYLYTELLARQRGPKPQ